MNNLKKSEQGVLVFEKLKGGKELEVAQQEVKRDIEYINNLKKETSAIKKEMVRVEKENQRTKDNFKKRFEKLQKSQERASKPIKSTVSNCSVHHLSRIIFCLKDIKKPIGITALSKDCCMVINSVKAGLLFLIKYKIAKEEYQFGVKVYSIEEQFKDE